MKIVIINAADFRIEVLNVPEEMLADGNGVEKFLAEHDYPLDNISWMAAPARQVPVRLHDYSFDDWGDEWHVSNENLMFGEFKQ